MQKKFISPKTFPPDGKTYFKKQAKPENAIAYCHNLKHMGYLSEKHIKQHQCIQKQCPLLERYEENFFWLRRRVVKEVKKLNKYGKGSIYIGERRFKGNNVEGMTHVAEQHLKDTGQIPEIIYKEI